MVFLNQVTHLGICSRERVSTFVQQLLLGDSIARGCHLRIQLTLCNAITHILLFHKTEDIVLMEFKGFKLLALFYKDDMPTVRRQERLAHLSGLQGKSGILELLHHLVTGKPSQNTATTSGTRILRHLLG